MDPEIRIDENAEVLAASNRIKVKEFIIEFSNDVMIVTELKNLLKSDRLLSEFIKINKLRFLPERSYFQKVKI